MNEFAQKRPLFALAGIILFQLALLSIQVRNEDGQRLIRSWTLTIFSPAARASDWIGSTVEGSVDGISELWYARSENERLKRELGLLKMELARQTELAALLPRTLAYDHLGQTTSYDLLWGRLIWRNGDYYRSRVLINVGSDQGVRPNFAVLIPSGVAGRVWQTARSSSEIELITNPGAAAGALVGRLRLPGIVSGHGSEVLKLEHVTQPEKVQIGDAVITSGTERIYPKGISIGTVSGIERTATGRYDLFVKPSAGLDRLEDVAVVLESMPRIPDEERAQETLPSAVAQRQEARKR